VLPAETGQAGAPRRSSVASRSHDRKGPQTRHAILDDDSIEKPSGQPNPRHDDHRLGARAVAHHHEDRSAFDSGPADDYRMTGAGRRLRCSLVGDCFGVSLGTLADRTVLGSCRKAMP
jgi:hypothetical protein